MGITIHYKAQLKPNEKYLIPKILELVKEKARKCNYKFRELEYKGFVTEDKLYDQNGKLLEKWFSFSEQKYNNSEAKESSIKEVIVHNQDETGNHLSESFSCGFYLNPFNNKYEWRDFTKTQIFNEKEAIPNIKFHVFIITLLMEIKLRFIDDLCINDEGDFFFTEKQRQESIKYFEKKSKEKPEYAKYVKYWKDINPFDLKVLIKSHGENLSLINGLTDTLKRLGWNESS